MTTALVIFLGLFAISFSWHIGNVLYYPILRVCADTKILRPFVPAMTILLSKCDAALRAICMHDTALAVILVERLTDAQVECLDEPNGWGLLARAVAHRQHSVVQALCDRGVDVNQIDLFGKSLLFIACESGDLVSAQ